MSGRAALRVVSLFLAVGLAGAGCSDDKTASGTTDAAAAAVEPTTCPSAAAVVEEDAFTVARNVIDAAQVWDVDALCALIGRVDIPNGLIRYRQAIIGGLSTDIELANKRSDDTAKTAEFAFDVPVKGAGTRLGLAFQRQSNGWVLLTAPFVASGAP